MSTFIGVLDRYWFHLGFSWPEEVSRFLFIWACSLAAIIAVKRKSHYVVDFAVKAIFSSKMTRIFEIYAYLISIGILLIVTYKGVFLTQIVGSQTSPGLRISMAYVYVAIPISAFLMIIYFTIEIVKLIINLDINKDR
jgi:TRAP-type C4-dicarboxylate transport system permease small subunit